MIKAVIFDCFGVLIGDGLEVVCQELEKTDPESRAFITEMMHLSNRGIIDPAESNQRIIERLGTSIEDWRARISQSETRNQPVLDLVRELRTDYKTALLSNIGRGSLKRRFSDEELAALFDVVVASAEVGMMKPDPEIYLLTAQRLGLTPQECVFIDDREAFVTAAREVGMQGIWFEGALQLRRDLDVLLHPTKGDG